MTHLVLALALFASSLTPDSAPAAGEYLTFTAVFDQDAAKQSRNPQFHDHPQIQVDCYQESVRVFTANTSIGQRSKIKGGWTGQSYPILLDFAGSANCYGTLYYFDAKAQLNVVAWAEFGVSP